MKKSFIVRLFALLLFCFISGNVYSNDKLVIVTEQYEPYEYLQNNQWIGLDIETITEMGKRAKIDIIIQEYPWARCLDMIEKGSADAIISLMKTKDREVYIRYPEESISFERNVLIAKKKFTKKISTLSDLSGEIIGTINGYEYPALFMNCNNFKRDESPNNITLLKKFSTDRLNVIIFNELVFYLQINKDVSELKNNINVLLEVGKDPLYIGFSKKSKNAVKLFDICNKTLKEMKKDGTIDKSINKYTK
ncbi:MAG TPA: transporter substrate-binding domain-containing protein [Spirochaetota bacterium]|nr:transporter substrate-binding domain-containing protein [Spirochaetota bacterium]